MMILFLVYINSYLIEFIYLLKGKTNQDLFSKAEETNKINQTQQSIGKYYNRKDNTDNSLDYNNDNNTGDSPEFKVDNPFNSNNKANKEINKNTNHNSSYSITEKTNTTITKDIDNYYTTKVNKSGEPVQQIYNTTELDEFEKAIQKYKILCYKNICLQIVQNPK